jgi:hypothetical protein
MLDPQKIFMSRIKQAYCLNEHEAQSLLHELSPDKVYPFELWQKAYSSFWKYPAAESAKLYEIENPCFPEICQVTDKYFPTETYSTWITNLFSRLAAIIHVEELEKGYDYIVETVYDTTENSFAKSKADLFYILERAEKNIANYTRVKGPKDISLSKSYYGFIHKIFPDTVAVDKIAAIYYLSVLNDFPLVCEVKGITHSLVDSVKKAAAEGTLFTEPEVPP